MPLMPEGSSLYVNAPLTNISVAYQQRANDYIAGQVFPVVPVNKQGGLFYKYDKGDWFRSIAGVRAPATETPGGGWNVTTDSYFSDVYGVHKDVDDQTRANADSMFSLDRDATQWVTQNLLLKRDQVFVSTYMTTGVWGLDVTGDTSVGSNQVIRWDLANATPIEDIRAQSTRIKSQTGYRPNTLILGPAVYDVLLDHPDILERIKYTERGMIGNALLASLFGVEQVLVADAIENTQAQSAGADTPTMGFMVGKSALLMYVNRTPSLMQPSAGYIFGWNGLLGAQATSTRIKKFRMEPIESDRIEGEMAWDMKIVSPDLATYFATIVS